MVYLGEMFQVEGTGRNLSSSSSCGSYNFLTLIAYHQREVFDLMDLLIISADAGAR